MRAGTQGIPQSPLEFAPNIMRTQGIASAYLAEVHRFRAPAADPLRWLESHAIRLTIQQIPAYRRPKNRVVLEFRDSASEVLVVGGRSIQEAVFKARIRQTVDGGTK